MGDTIHTSAAPSLGGVPAAGSHADRNWSLAAACVTILFWASSFPGIRAGLEGYEPRHLVTLRFLVASAVLAVPAWRGRVRVPERRHWSRIAWLGLTGIAGYNLALTYGETHVPAATASVLVNTAPVFTTILAALFLGEPLVGRGIAGLALAFSGAALIATSAAGGWTPSVWVALVLLAAFLQAASFTLQKSLYTFYSPLELTCYAIWCGALANLVWVPGLAGAIGGAPAHATLAVLYLGVGPAAISYLAWAYVLRHMSASRATSLLYVIPAVSALISWAWLGEVPTAATVGGGILILCGVGLVHTSKRSG